MECEVIARFSLRTRTSRWLNPPVTAFVFFWRKKHGIVVVEIIRTPVSIRRRGKGNWEWKFLSGIAQGSDLGDNT